MGDKFSNCLVVRRKNVLSTVNASVYFNRLSQHLNPFAEQTHLLCYEKKNGCDAKRENKNKWKANGLVGFIHVSGLKGKTDKHQRMVIDTIFGWLVFINCHQWCGKYFVSVTLPTEYIASYDMKHWKWVTMNIYTPNTECWIAKCKRDDIDVVKRVLFTRIHNSMASNWI